jgi:hypothetical protein
VKNLAAVAMANNHTDWMRTVYADKKLEPYARQLAGIVSARFSNRGCASFYDVDATAFLDLTSNDIGNLRRQLMEKGYLRALPTGGNCRPQYQLTFGPAPQRAKADSEEEAA